MREINKECKTCKHYGLKLGYYSYCKIGLCVDYEKWEINKVFVVKHNKCIDCKYDGNSCNYDIYLYCILHKYCHYKKNIFDLSNPINFISREEYEV